jgi:hypothetical protein
MGETIEIGSTKQDMGAVAAASVISTAITEVAAVVKELERVAISSPVTGAVMCLIIGDILHNAGRQIGSDGRTVMKNGIISDGTWLGIQTIIYSGVGLSLASTVIADVTAISDIIGTRAAQPSIFTPSVTTLVIGDGSGQKADLQALLSMINKK